MPADAEQTWLSEEIRRLKDERRAVILAHNYQLGEVQDIADFTGDSLELSLKARETDARVIVFCGVHFMAETAAILCPDKLVLLPRPEAGCLMADMVDAPGLRRLKAEHPGALVICYVNTTAAVKAECDLCCTSANAVKLVSQVPPERPIIFVPDRYLGAYVEERTGRQMILWPGCCPTHLRILPEHIRARRQQFPQAKVIVHPECRPEVTALADEVLSTGGMVRYVRETMAHTIIVGTEMGIIHRLRKERPEKLYIPATEQAICPQMKLIRLEDVHRALTDLAPPIAVPEEVRKLAERSLLAMLEASR
jgi:quinolinate synthase